jgi:phosphoglycerate dehydrogenase-like enzyme
LGTGTSAPRNRPFSWNRCFGSGRVAFGRLPGYAYGKSGKDIFSMHRLLMITGNNARFLELLRAADLPDLELVAADNEAGMRAVAAECDIFFGEPRRIAPLLPAAARLAWVQSSFAGVEALCSPGLRRDYRLTGVKGIFGLQMSEYVFAYMLALERNLFTVRANQKERRWRDLSFRPLCDLTLGICGLGDIGRHIAATAAHFGMRVVGYKHSPADVPHVERVYSGTGFDAFLSLPDYLVLVLPRTAATDNLIDAAALGCMKPSAVLINVGRGNAVNEGDLAAALQERRIRAAVLDVFESEPLPEESPLWAVPNLFITPHNAGKSVAEDVVPIFCANYRRWRKGEPLNYAIDFDKGY